MFLVLNSASCFADSIDGVIQPLGLSREDLNDTWYSGRCAPEWSIEIEQEIANDVNLLGYKGLESGFFESEDVGDMVRLRAGSKCAALTAYYFEGVQSHEISEFIDRDKTFIAKYGYTVLDAIYVEKAQFFSMNGEVDKFRLKFVSELARKGLFTLTQESSTFNGKPSIAHIGKRTSLGDEFHDKVFP
jgi:hypothetical protein